MRRDPRAYLDIYLVEFVGGNRFVFTFDAMLFTDILDNSPKLPLAGVVEVALGDGFQTLPGPGLYVGLIEGIEPAKVNVELSATLLLYLLVSGSEPSAITVSVTPPASARTSCQLTRLYSVKCPITRPAPSLFT